MDKIVKLGFCVGGIYACFLGWGYYQEALTTTVYDGGKFSYFLVMNTSQSIAAMISCLTVFFLKSLFQGKEKKHHKKHSHEKEEEAIQNGKESTNGVTNRKSDHQTQKWSLKLMLGYAIVALTICLGSPLSYAALKYINFPTMVLSKSCKLVPVMIVQVLVYRRSFPLYQYLSVILITLGASLFFLLQPSKGGDVSGNSLFGLFLVTLNLFLDGFTNSTEDKIFRDFKVSSLELMFFLNFFQTIFMSSYLLFNPFTHELHDAISFLTHNPAAFNDLIYFAFAGACGQLVVFYTLENFGSLTLVTITVTRKLFSIILSVIAFGHNISSMQWVCVVLVFVGIGLESFMKEKKKRHHHTHHHKKKVFYFFKFLVYSFS